MVFDIDIDNNNLSTADKIEYPDFSKVEISLTGNRTLRDIISEDNGTYVFPNLPEDDYRLRVYFDGYKVFDRNGFCLPPSIPYDIIVKMSSISQAKR